MKTRVILFDLDGTLLPMDQDVFVKTYFSELYKSLAHLGYSADKFKDAMWSGIGAMFKNDGAKTNEELFWKAFVAIMGKESLEHLPHFEKFYDERFDGIQQICGFNPNAKHAIEKIKEMGFKIAAATQPVFPAIATQKRLKWAGLSHEDFELYTTYENSHFCKPRLEYYEEITKKLDVQPAECLMVGNDVNEDMVAEQLGMKVFLLTDHLINKDNKDISKYPQGSFDELLEFVANL